MDDGVEKLSRPSSDFQIHSSCDEILVFNGTSTSTDGHTEAGDIETTMTCVFDLEQTSRLLEGSTQSGKLAPCDLSTLAPSSTKSYNGPKTVFVKSSVVNAALVASIA